MTNEFKNATYWVGCSTENANCIMFTLEQVMLHFSEHDYITAFDTRGRWVDEAKVSYDAQDDPYLNFNY